MFEVEQRLLEAHDRGAWLVLGYTTWEQYAKKEFHLSRKRSYQLAAGAKVREILRMLPSWGGLT
jgi:hypothetical protein